MVGHEDANAETPREDMDLAQVRARIDGIERDPGVARLLKHWS